MRDIAVALIVLGLLPAAVLDPFVGIALWTWLSVMNPHRLAFGFAYDFPWAMIVAIATFVGLVLGIRKVSFPWSPASVALLAFSLWVTVTVPFAIHVRESIVVWLWVSKMLLMTLVALAVVRSERQIKIFLWIFLLSVTFFGVKGGFFAIVTGGEFKVYGPTDSQIEDNNSISVALVMMIPLMWFAFQSARHRLVRYAMPVCIALSSAAVFASYSRGALVAVCAMVSALAIKSKRKGLFVLFVVVALGVIAASMPEKWWERMSTIMDKNVDSSVQGRFNAWQMAWNLAVDHPIAGGGFAIYEPDVFLRYAPDPNDLHSAHSIYFQMLGEHGFVGLALFFLVALTMWRTGTRVIRGSRTPETIWRANLARALQVSMIGFMVGGLTVNIGYWDVFYFELVLLVALERLIAAHAAQPARAAVASPLTASTPRLP